MNLGTSREVGSDAEGVSEQSIKEDIWAQERRGKEKLNEMLTERVHEFCFGWQNHYDVLILARGMTGTKRGGMHKWSWRGNTK